MCAFECAVNAASASAEHAMPNIFYATYS